MGQSILFHTVLFLLISSVVHQTVDSRRLKRQDGDINSSTTKSPTETVTQDAEEYEAQKTEIPDAYNEQETSNTQVVENKEQGNSSKETTDKVDSKQQTNTYSDAKNTETKNNDETKNNFKTKTIENKETSKDDNKNNENVLSNYDINLDLDKTNYTNNDESDGNNGVSDQNKEQNVVKLFKLNDSRESSVVRVNTLNLNLIEPAKKTIDVNVIVSYKPNNTLNPNDNTVNLNDNTVNPNDRKKNNNYQDQKESNIVKNGTKTNKHTLTRNKDGSLLEKIMSMNQHAKNTTQMCENKIDQYSYTRSGDCSRNGVPDDDFKNWFQDVHKFRSNKYVTEDFSQNRDRIAPTELYDGTALRKEVTNNAGSDEPNFGSHDSSNDGLTHHTTRDNLDGNGYTDTPECYKIIIYPFEILGPHGSLPKNVYNDLLSQTMDNTLKLLHQREPNGRRNYGQEVNNMNYDNFNDDNIHEYNDDNFDDY